MKGIKNCKSIGVNSLLKVCFFDKKRCIIKCTLKIEDIQKYLEYINKSKLVVFDIKEIDKEVFMNELLNLTILRKRYSPIIEVGNSKVFLFPQLNYGDIYLLKTLFQQEYVNESIHFNLGVNVNVK